LRWRWDFGGLLFLRCLSRARGGWLGRVKVIENVYVLVAFAEEFTI
jgi:hypothetical protein